MKTYLSCSLRLGAFFVAMLALSSVAQGHFKFLSVENESYGVELIRWERYGPEYDDVRFDLLVRTKGKTSERVVTVENLTTGLAAAEIAGSTLVLFGEMKSKARTATLVDLDAAKVTDFILHYGASLSPSRRYLVFKAFYPPYGMVQSRSDAVRIYDLSKESGKNRLMGGGSSTAGQGVGMPIYPLENVDPPTYLVWVPEESRRHHVDNRVGFLWARDERSLFFIDRTGNQQLLVRVDLEEDSMHPRITTQPIDPAPALTIAPRDLEGSPEGEHEYLALTGMRFEAGARIRLELDRELFERNVYRVTHMSIAQPEPAPVTHEAGEQ